MRFISIKYIIMGLLVYFFKSLGGLLAIFSYKGCYLSFRRI